VLLAVGDISTCDRQDDEAVAALASRLPGTIALLGDLAYDDATTAEFRDCFAPAWSPMQERLRPAPGNHEYLSPNAAPYFEFFGAAAGTPGEGWYSYDLGTWHLIALNSNCDSIGGCDAGSPQLDWLEADLAAHPTDCLLAYWHQARYSSGLHGSSEETEPLWAALLEAGMDVALTAHDHSYERLRIGDMREFVVGTGGKSHYPFEEAALPTTEVRNADTFGLLSLTLGEGRYEWEFVPVGTATFSDAGTGECA
jgi:3',5'-cyclic AMP phosphodiesterase CpdA